MRKTPEAHGPHRGRQRGRWYVPATNVTVVDATTITAVTPAGTAGATSVAVTTPGGTVRANLFTYLTPQAPTLATIAPLSGTTLGGTPVTLSGTFLTGATALTIGGVAATSVVVVNDSTVTAMTLAHAAGVVDVVLTTPSGTVTAARLYAYVTRPTVTAIAPTSGTTLGLTPVTITGTNFTGATAVIIGSAVATSVTVVNATTTAAVTPAHAAGVVDVAVTTPAGIGTATGLYTYVTPHFVQQGPKLVGTGAFGAAYQGSSVAVSADGNTAIVGGRGDNSNIGAAWIFTRSGGAWIQQGHKLVGTGAAGQSYQGSSVALSADGNTAVVGGIGDNSSVGAAWVYTRSGGAWTQQGNKLVGTGVVGSGGSIQGVSVALSADGNTAVVGGASPRRTCTKPCGPSPPRASEASAARKNFVHHHRNTFSTASVKSRDADHVAGLPCTRPVYSTKRTRLVAGARPWEENVDPAQAAWVSRVTAIPTGYRLGWLVMALVFA